MFQRNLRTVCEVLTNAVCEVLEQNVRVHPSGRTDSGVHALKQVCQFDAELTIPISKMTSAINEKLPEDLRILNCYIVDKSFNVLEKSWKRYVYRIVGSLEQVQAFAVKVLRRDCGRLELSPMREAAALLQGNHNFLGFTADREKKDAERILYRCHILDNSEGIAIVMEGDRFLRYMCRIIAGTLLGIGCGLFPPERVSEIFECGDRDKAGPTLPPSGLCLECVEHGAEWSPELSDSIPISSVSNLATTGIDLQGLQDEFMQKRKPDCKRQLEESEVA